jgi:1-acyl-sn-glycerol-3-phosphate acyltransferase
VEILPMGLAYPAGCEFVDESFTQHMLRVSMRPRTNVGIAVGAPYLLEGSRDEAVLHAQQRVQDLVLAARGAFHSP